MTNPSQPLDQKHPSSAAPVASSPLDSAGQAKPVAPGHGGGAATGAVRRPQDTHYDPAGNPIEFTSSSVRDQQAGGDMTGREPETRDDNYVDNAQGDGLNRQMERDIGTRIDDFGTVTPGKDSPAEIEPDGTEDPLASLDDHVGIAGSKDGAESKQRPR